jgi:hypothetical protein
MRIPEARWLVPLSWGVLALSSLETAVFASGDLDRKAGLAVLSIASVFLGLAAVTFVLGSHYVFARATRSLIPGYSSRVDSCSMLSFWFGAVAAPLIVLLYPFGSQEMLQEMPFSMAPVGIGFAWGAKWTYKRYSGNDDSAQPSNRLDATTPSDGGARDDE